MGGKGGWVILVLGLLVAVVDSSCHKSGYYSVVWCVRSRGELGGGWYSLIVAVVVSSPLPAIRPGYYSVV